MQALATRRLRLATVFLLLASAAAWAQSQPPKSASAPAASNDVSGMYTFLREGEFVEVDVEPDGRVNGFVSRYGDLDSDRGAFLDHMFTKGSMQGNKLAFTTRSVHGISFEFKGTVQRGEGKTPGAEAYWTIKGTLTQITEDKDHKQTAQQREVVFKSFPAEAMVAPQKRD
ncbi:MAG: hypothetical protein LAN64_01100 [Acidobacteriia bacterium]|nr:hypothetical protein [Terriglobia bacterium]